MAAVWRSTWGVTVFSLREEHRLPAVWQWRATNRSTAGVAIERRLRLAVWLIDLSPPVESCRRERILRWTKHTSRRRS